MAVRRCVLRGLSARPTLAAWLLEWGSASDGRRTELLVGLRAFLESCPACHVLLQQVEELRQSCCGCGELVDVIDCEACGALEFTGRYA
ncbi:MAG: hypothetical protein U5K28_04460 [Halobacteriales archaeon]|nr:hypothetical protein [Halobacteriales archaeon]